MIQGLVLMAIATFMAWRLSKTEADPDFAMFSLSGFTGSWYGRDFADCKTPMIHLWYHLLHKISNGSIERVKFLHHFILGMVGTLYYAITGSFIPAWSTRS